MDAGDLSHLGGWPGPSENWRGWCPRAGIPHGNCWHWKRARRLRDALCSAFSQSPGSRPSQIGRSNPTHCLSGKAKAERLAVAFSHSSCHESVPRGRGGQSHLSHPSLYDLEQATLPSILTWGWWKRGEWVSPKSSEVVTACYRRPFQEPSISPGIPSEAVLSKGGGACQVLGHC